MNDLVIRDIDTDQTLAGGETYAEAIERIFHLRVEVVQSATSREAGLSGLQKQRLAAEALRREAGLDAERLAEALHRAGVCQNWSPGYGFTNSAGVHEDHHGAAEHTEAARIAAEYARLSDEPS